MKIMSTLPGPELIAGRGEPREPHQHEPMRFVPRHALRTMKNLLKNMPLRGVDKRSASTIRDGLNVVKVDALTLIHPT